VGRKSGRTDMARAKRGSAEDGDAEAPLARRAWDQIWPLAVAVLVALSIRAVVIESYYVPSESMLPTLLIGDHVFVPGARCFGEIRGLFGGAAARLAALPLPGRSLLAGEGNVDIRFVT